MSALLDPAGPAVVAIGGGHGLAASLQAIRRYASSVTAVVSVADDGGSSGRLREDLPDLPAPGDVRRCLGALADPASELAGLLEHRFDEDGPLQGHAYGNLLLAALAFGLGSFPAAVAEVTRMTGGVGAVLPATLDAVELACTLLDEPDMAPIIGQVEIAHTSGRRRLWLRPTDCASPPEAVDAVLAADQIVLGPGSLYTSVLAAAVAPEIADALRRTRGKRILVANLWTQIPEAEGFTVADHVQAFLDHDIPIDGVLAQTGTISGDTIAGSIPLRTAEVADDRGRAHHPGRLAAALRREHHGFN